MNNIFFNHIDINLENTNIPSGSVKDLAMEAFRYDKLLEKIKLIFNCLE